MIVTRGGPPLARAYWVSPRGRPYSFYHSSETASVRKLGRRRRSARARAATTPAQTHPRPRPGPTRLVRTRRSRCRAPSRTPEAARLANLIARLSHAYRTLIARCLYVAQTPSAPPRKHPGLPSWSPATVCEAWLPALAPPALAAAPSLLHILHGPRRIMCLTLDASTRAGSVRMTHQGAEALSVPLNA